jgi:hypothetical protein
VSRLSRRDKSLVLAQSGHSDVMMPQFIVHGPKVDFPKLPVGLSTFQLCARRLVPLCVPQEELGGGSLRPARRIASVMVVCAPLVTQRLYGQQRRIG